MYGFVFVVSLSYVGSIPLEILGPQGYARILLLKACIMYVSVVCIGYISDSIRRDLFL
jgi:hypothetical protein